MYGKIAAACLVTIVLVGAIARGGSGAVTNGATPTSSPTPVKQITEPFPLHFTSLPTNVVVGRPMGIGATGTPPHGATLSFAWDFGDSNQATGDSVTHTYGAPGLYMIELTATASTGGSAMLRTYVGVSPRLPAVVLELPPGESGTFTYFPGCPGTAWVEGLGYITGSCGGGIPRDIAVQNDGDQPLSFAWSLVDGTVTIAAPDGYVVVAPDLGACVPRPPGPASEVVCPAGQLSIIAPAIGGGRVVATLRISAVPAETYPTTVSYPAGWNLIAGVTLPEFGPDGSRNVGITVYGRRYDGTYVSLPLDFPLDTGITGYWAYFPYGSTGRLSARGRFGGTLMVRGGSWNLAGNPGQVPVEVRGADEVLTYDPLTGNYLGATTLVPGQGAWIYATESGTVTFVPVDSNR